MPEESHPKMLIHATRTMLAVTFAAGCFGHDASASAMKNLDVPVYPPHITPADPLPLLLPTYPLVADAPVTPGDFATPAASLALYSPSPSPFARDAFVATLHQSPTVHPTPRRPLADRSKSGASLERAEFSLPEPSSIILVLTGLIGLTARRQMRRHSAKHV